MSILDYFKPTPAWPAVRVAEFLEESDPGTYNLIDVRQPKEYEQGHLPGAVLVPLAELEDRLGEFDRSRPTVVY